ncbi:unnamed protein product [Rangifer tarandus platyrhynchus]|uniref:Uncharacterized protein n=2 Tax=Rangifer tarandus platyrhynchus TaxID=3082113 RepID=A0AC59ZQS9_RANTA|nr:unnamed protein product [Rangifer tarandus platyrhynchus]
MVPCTCVPLCYLFNLPTHCWHLWGKPGSQVCDTSQCMHVCTPSSVAMATSKVRKQHPKGSCPHEDQARLLVLCSAHHICSLWRIPSQIFTALLPPPDFLLHSFAITHAFPMRPLRKQRLINGENKTLNQLQAQFLTSPLNGRTLHLPEPQFSHQ